MIEELDQSCQSSEDANYLCDSMCEHDIDNQFCRCCQCSNSLDFCDGCYKSFALAYCIECTFCKYCIFCDHLDHKEFYIHNKQVTREEYIKACKKLYIECDFILEDYFNEHDLDQFVSKYLQYPDFVQKTRSCWTIFGEKKLIITHDKNGNIITKLD